MRSKILLFAAVCLAAVCLCACTNAEAAAEPSSSDSGIRIVTTIFPEYDWVRNILGENPAGAELTMLLDNGVDLHSYQPTADDILKIAKCDLFIYVGGESDSWVDDALREAVNKDMIVIDLLDELGNAVKEEELVEGMEGEEEEEGDEEGPEYDEHVWLSLRNARTLCSSIEAALEKIDAKNGQICKVKIDAKERSLVFDDVVIRVSDKFALAMHIDTDEGNAANWSSGLIGDIVL